jgi:hypothetical protein
MPIGRHTVVILAFILLLFFLKNQTTPSGSVSRTPTNSGDTPDHTVPKARGDFIVNNKNKKHSSYGMKSFILQDECFQHFIINKEIINRFWNSACMEPYILKDCCFLKLKIKLYSIYNISIG